MASSVPYRTSVLTPLRVASTTWDMRGLLGEDWGETGLPNVPDPPGERNRRVFGPRPQGYRRAVVSRYAGFVTGQWSCQVTSPKRTRRAPWKRTIVAVAPSV